MFHDIVQHYISEQLQHFVRGLRCCQEFSGSFRSSERRQLEFYASALGLHTQLCIQNGLEVVKVHKRFCRHFSKTTVNFDLQPQSAKELFLYQYFEESGNQKLNSINLGIGRPTVSSHYFLLDPLKKSIPRASVCGSQNFRKLDNLHMYKQHLLHMMEHNRVLVINGDCHFEMSTALPMYIIEKSANQRSHCKIICVEKGKFMATCNGERLAERLREKVGNTVAYQVELESRISEASNIIYTTSRFFLRTLTGQTTNTFQSVSHVVLADLHVDDIFGHVLLLELRKALRLYDNLRIVLLTHSNNNAQFLEYFGEGKEIRLEAEKNGQVRELYIDEIRAVVARELLQTSHLTYSASAIINRDYDIYLERYESSGSDQAFVELLHVVHTQNLSINSPHSCLGNTIITIAAGLGKIAHLSLLLQLHADPFIKNKLNSNAISSAVLNGKTECVKLLTTSPTDSSVRDVDVAFFDYNLVIDLIRVLASGQWEPGNILVIAPSYAQVIRLNFFLQKHKLIGSISPKVSVLTLHDKVKKYQLEHLKVESPGYVKVILATEIAETVAYLFSVSYVIDCARIQQKEYNYETGSQEIGFRWISQENLKHRSLTIDSSQGKGGACFRLIPKFMLDHMPKVRSPQMLTMPLDRVCLFAKVLSKRTTVAEYLKGAIVRPDFRHVQLTVEHLKNIDVFDDNEDITWLGARLIDVPSSCQLGKQLIFAILLQCLDPMLTIASFFCSMDPLKMPNDIDALLRPYIAATFSKVENNRKGVTHGIYSDHLVYLRLYQDWQDGLHCETLDTGYQDEKHYIFNKILENVHETRTHLVAALRAANLIHSQGQLCMRSVNLKSNSWPMIKSALVGGLYPNICPMDSTLSSVKNTLSKQVKISADSMLHELLSEPLHAFEGKVKSAWIVYGNEVANSNGNNITCCTLIPLLAIAIFAKSAKLHPSQVISQNAKTSFGTSVFLYHFNLDERTQFSMNPRDAELVLRTRQYFYNMYIHYLQHCGNINKYRSKVNILTKVPDLLDTIEKALLHEESMCGFVQPGNVGSRPKAMLPEFRTL